jgi:phosphoglycolate phosphatase
VAAVIFDLDGTLVDSAAAIRDVANLLMSELGLPLLKLTEARSYIGHGASRFLERALAEREAKPDAHQFAAHLSRFQQLYDRAPGNANVPYAGVEVTLRQLSASAHCLGLCTNKPEAATHGVLDAHGWRSHFSVIVTGDTLPQRKPHPAPLQYAARHLQTLPVIFVGDSEIDAQTAQAAQLPFVLFTEGYRQNAVDDLPHVAAFSSYCQLPRLLAVVIEDLAS